MASRIVIGGRQIGTGRYGGDRKCLCGDRVEVLGRCLACHEALRRRRIGLPPSSDQEAKRLAGYLDKFETESSRCSECGARLAEAHDPRCQFA